MSSNKKKIPASRIHFSQCILRLYCTWKMRCCFRIKYIRTQNYCNEPLLQLRCKAFWQQGNQFHAYDVLKWSSSLHFGTEKLSESSLQWNELPSSPGKTTTSSYFYFPAITLLLYLVRLCFTVETHYCSTANIVGCCMINCLCFSSFVRCFG